MPRPAKCQEQNHQRRRAGVGVNSSSTGLSAATARKAVFALRQCLAAAIADERLQFNPACAVPLPTERQKPPRYLAQSEGERLVDEMPRQTNHPTSPFRRGDRGAVVA